MTVARGRDGHWKGARRPRRLSLAANLFPPRARAASAGRRLSGPDEICYGGVPSTAMHLSQGRQL